MGESKNQFMEDREQEQFDDKKASAVEPVDVRMVSEEKLNKLEMERLSDKMIYDVEQGESPALPRYVRIDFLIKTLELAKKKLKESATNEIERLTKDETFMGVEIRGRAGGGRHNYKGNPAWVELKGKLDGLQEQMKMAFKAEDASIVDNDTGEVIPSSEYVPSAPSIELRFPSDGSDKG